MDTIIEQSYHTLVSTELHHIQEIAVAQSHSGMDWNQASTFIRKDLIEYAKKIDVGVASEIGILAVRAWMELWVPVQEKHILDIIRWVGGPSESDLAHSHSITCLPVKCTCPVAKRNTLANHSK